MTNPPRPVLELDSSREALATQARILAEMSPAEKIEIVEDANRTARELAWAGICLRHPEAPEEDKTRILLGLLLGERLAMRVFGPSPLER